MPKQTTPKPKFARGAASRGVAHASTRGSAGARGGETARRVHGWIPLAIALLTAFAFAPALQNGFTDWDDPAYVTDQPLVRDVSFSGLETIFRSVVEGNYHPVTIASLAVDFHFWKLEPRGYHLVNLALHIVATTLVFVFIFLLTGSNLLAGLTALLFGVHPLHVESVAWVSGRKDPLYTIFYLGACIAYVLWARGRRPKALYYGGALLLFALSLLAKGMAVCLPGALLAIDFFLRRKLGPKLLIEKIPFFAIALVIGYVAVVAQSRQGAVQDLEWFAFYERILFACYGICFYLVRAIIPGPLSALYPYPLRTAGLPMIYFLAPLGVLLFAAAVAWSLRKGRTFAFGALFFLVNVALVLQLFPVGSAVVADRYTYLSYVGVGLMLASLVRGLVTGPLARSVFARGAVVAVLALATVGAVFATRARCEVWKDNVTLWNDVLRQYPTLPLGYTMRARTWMQRGRNDLALADAEKAINLDPKQPRALTIRGTIRYLNRDNPGALTDLEKAVEIEPKEAVPWNSLGAVHLALGKHDLALADFTRAVERKPDYAEAYLNRALTLSGMGRIREALSDFDASIGLQPRNVRAHLWRAEARYRTGNKEGAAEDYGSALELEPNDGAVWYARAQMYQRLGRYADALRDATRARSLGYALPPGYLDRLKAPPSSP